MKSLMIFSLILLILEKLKGKSLEYYLCLDPNKSVRSTSTCTSLKIPESDGYKCCGMKITINKTSSYSCFAIEKKYTTSQEVLDEYISAGSLAILFSSIGGQIEIECGNDMKITQNYEKISDEYLNCYNSHINATENENDCTKNNIPDKEGSKCCFVETSEINNNGNIIDDKRCYIIQDEYFTKDKDLNDYLLDQSGSGNLDEIINTNVTIKCKNYDKYYFQGKYVPINPVNNILNDHTNDSSSDLYLKDHTTDDSTNFNLNEQTTESSTDLNLNESIINRFPLPEKEKKSKLKSWAIIIIILAFVIIIGIITLIIILYCRSKKIKLESDKKNEVGNDSEKDINNKTKSSENIV